MRNSELLWIGQNENYVRSLCKEIQWINVGSFQLKSDLFTREQADQLIQVIRSHENSDNYQAYQIFESRKDPQFYRIVVSLDKVNKKMERV